MDLNAQECNAGGRLKSTRSARKSSQNTGQTQGDGTIYEPFRRRPPKIGASISSVVVSRAKISATRAKVPELKANDRDYGKNLLGSFAYYDQKSSLWKMSRRCLLEELMWFSGIWPRAGIMRNGIVYRRCSLVRRWKRIGYFLLPSPVKALANVGSYLTASMKFHTTKNGIPRKISNTGISGSVGLTRLLKLWTGKYPRATFVEWMAGFPKNWTQSAQ